MELNLLPRLITRTLGMAIAGRNGEGTRPGDRKLWIRRRERNFQLLEEAGWITPKKRARLRRIVAHMLATHGEGIPARKGRGVPSFN